MKHLREIFFRTIPVLLIIAITLVLSDVVSKVMIRAEEKDCWEALNLGTHNTATTIAIRMGDNMNMLDRVADAIVMQADMGEKDSVLNYLSSVQETTLFSSIEILLPDGSILLQNGDYITNEGLLSYDELLAKGAHLSSRRTHPATGKEVFYYFTPVMTDGKIEAILSGTIDCATMPDYFPSHIYDHSATVFLVDRANGDFLMNNWHDELGNIYAMGRRERVPGFEGKDFLSEIAGGLTGNVAFYSQTNGEASYMCYMPVDGFNWELCLMVQESQVFADVNQLRDILMKVGIVESIVLLLFLAWNVVMARSVIRHQEHAHRMEVERMTNEAKTRFLSSVSHDIRTPINGIIGMLDVIERHGDDPRRLKDGLHKIEVSAQYLLTLVNDVLDLNAIDSGKTIFANEAIDLRRMAEDMDFFIKSRAESAGVSYHMDCSGLKNPHVLGSPVHLHRILVNLTSNAVKYNRPGGQVWVRFEEAGHGLYRFVVQDTGIGMTEEFQKNMFDSFEQENAGARSGQQGHGLGLSIVKRLVEKMGGSIQVESRKDVGSTFTVELPLKVDANPQRDLQEATANEDPTSLQGMRILLAEDNELNVEIAEILLSDAGATVTVATNGRIAAELFAASPANSFDMILMDLMMPEMDGLEATRAIRSLDRPDADTIPIIAMTASTFDEDIVRCMEAGMNEHVGKPLDMAALIARLARYRKN